MGVLASVACAIPTPNEDSDASGPNPHYGGYYGGYYGYRPYYGYGYGYWGRKKRSTDEAVAAVPDVADEQLAPRDEEVASGPHYGGYWGGYRGYYGYPYYGGYYGWGCKKRNAEETVGDDISEPEIESGPHGYYGWGGYGYGGYRGYYGYPYYRGYGYGYWGRKKRNAEETVGDDISEGEEGSGPDPHYGYYYGGYRPYWGGYGWGGYRGYGWGGYGYWG